MRLIQTLLRQHIGWHFNKHWRIQGKRKPLISQAEKILKERNVVLEDPNEFIRDNFTPVKLDLPEHLEKMQPLDKTHPNWHDRALLTYNDTNVLLEGLDQAKILTNCVEILDGLPEQITLPNADVVDNLENRVKKIILNSHILDAEQKKLPKIKDPERPAFNFPRIYGVTQNRVFRLLISKLLRLIEATTDASIVKQRYLSNDIPVCYTFQRDEDLIQFQLTADFLLLSNKSLQPFTNEPTEQYQLPDIFPIKSTITLKPEHIYLTDNIYPLSIKYPKNYPHTIFINYNKETVKNLYEEEVTEKQICGRGLLKTFTTAAAYAKKIYGENVEKLPSPLSLQSIQTDGKQFYFSVFQLNTLNLQSEVTKNVWYRAPVLDLFTSCKYDAGQPILMGYNSEVIQHLIGFYNTV